MIEEAIPWYDKLIPYINFAIMLQIFVIAFLTAYPSSNIKRVSAVIYAAPIVMYSIFSDGLNDVSYYLVAALLSLFTAMILVSIPKNSLQTPLAELCGVSVLLNFAGWVIYSPGFSQILYNLAFFILYSVAIRRLIQGGHGDEGDTGNARHRAGLYRHAPKSLQHRVKTI